ncbi:MAG: hypothetical protein A2017_14870 [Lentisphaerae bacterium GWF2_44_16]|nr:MAG: hypothetical protein A2017_14870 [Lentisphaerae bacterium GWF2_44_16]
MNVELLSTILEGQYTSFIEGSSDASIYHSLEWRDVLLASYGFYHRCLIALENGAVRGALPIFEVNSLLRGRRGISMPFSHMVPLLANDVKTMDALLAAARDMVSEKKMSYIELRHGVPLDKPFCQDICNYNISRLDLKKKSLDHVWKSFRTAIRNQTRKAEKNGIETKVAESSDEYRVFYELEAETRKFQGMPIYPLSLFLNIYEKLHKAGKSRLELAYYNGKPIAGAMAFFSNGKAIYAYGSSRKDREYMSLCPNNILVWDLIKYSYNTGCEIFDFGSTFIQNEGLLHFKKQWGTETVPLYYSILSESQSPPLLDRNGFKVELVRKFLKHCPMPLFKALGPFLIKESC